MANGIYSHYLDNLIWDATVTANASPMTSYQLATLISLYPSARLRFSTGTVTITLTLGSAITPQVLAIPVSNLAGAVLTLTNAAGLSQAVTLPTMPANGIPLTAVLDFSGVSNRTSTVYRLVISGNAANVILGGGLWLGTKRSLTTNFRYSFHEIEEQPGPETENEYGTEYLVNTRTQRRRFQCDFNTRGAGIAELKAWHQDGRRRPTLFWPDPSINDAYVGRWLTDYDAERAHPRSVPISLTFGELAKGKPVA